VLDRADAIIDAAFQRFVAGEAPGFEKEEACASTFTAAIPVVNSGSQKETLADVDLGMEVHAMNPQIVAALVTAGASLIVSVIAYVRAMESQRYAVKVGEAAKRSEQMRVKATQAGERLLEEFAEVIRLAEGFEADLATVGAASMTAQQVVQRVAPIAKAAGKIRQLMYSTAIYTTPEIRQDVEASFAPITTAGGVQLARWSDFVEHLRKSHLTIAEHFKSTYLEISL
jgi:hypothetical protein